MGKSNLPTPDSIRAQSIQTPYSDLKPADKTRSVYQEPTAVNVAPPVKENSFQQLAGALSDLQPTLNQGVRYIADIDEKRLKANAEAASNEAAQQKNVRDLKEAQRQGYLPNGASPIFIKAWKENFLKLRAEQGLNDMREAYYNNAELRNSDDPNAYQKWATDWWKNYSGDVLKDGSEGMAFTQAEIGNSKFYDILGKGVQDVRGEHIKWRVSERERLAGETADNLTQTSLAKYFQNPDGTLKDRSEVNFADAAKAAGDPYWSRTGMAEAGGMTNKEAMERFQDSLLAYARTTKNPEVLSLANHVATPGGKLADSTKWKEKAEQARQYIAGTTYQDMIQKEQVAKLGVVGKSLDDRIKVYAMEQDLHMQDLQRPAQVRDMSTKIYLHPVNSEADIKARDEWIGKLFQVSPETAWQVKQNLERMEEHKQEKARTHLQDQIEMGLMNHILDNPLDPSNETAIAQALAGEGIDGNGMRRLMGMVNTMREKGDKYSALSDKGYKDLEYGVFTGVGGDPTKMGGYAAVVATQARYAFREMAINEIEKNPALARSGQALAEIMHDKVQKLVERYNPMSKQARVADEDRQRQEKETADMAAKFHDAQPKIEAEQKKLKAFDQGKGPDPNAQPKQPKEEHGPTPKKLSEMLSGKDRNHLLSSFERAWLPGVNEKPITEQALRDEVRGVFEKFYKKPEELNNAVNGFIEAQRNSKKYKKAK